MDFILFLLGIYILYLLVKPAIFNDFEYPEIIKRILRKK